MKIFIYLYILKLLAHTESATNPKAVNVQLETILEFNDKDKDADVKFIGNIQKILKKVKIALSPENGRRSLSNNYNSNSKHIQFTDFILAAVDILLSYDDDDLENAFSILNDEIRKYHYKGCKFYELVENENVRQIVARNLDDLKKKKAKTLRKKLYKVVNIIGNAKLISNHRQFVDYINSLYRFESSKTFMNILQNLENYRYKSKRSNMNLIEITRNGIRSVLFDYYSKLHQNVRKDIKKNIENTSSHIKNSELKLTDEHNENDFVNIIADETQTYSNSKEDKSEVYSSVSDEDNSHIKINIHNEMDRTAGKKNHKTIRQAIENKESFLTQRPVINTVKQIDQEFTAKTLKLKPLSEERLANETNGQYNDFRIPTENVELKSHRFERKERKENKKRNKHKMKTNVKDRHKDDDIRVEKKRKKNKHRKLKANVDKTENLEDTVIVKEETLNDFKSESSLRRPKKTVSQFNSPKETGLHDVFINILKKFDEKRPQDLETKTPPRKRKKIIKTKRKQFKKPTMKLNIYSLSDEGMSIEDEHYRRTMIIENDSVEDKENDNNSHKTSAEIIRKHFMTRINNLEKQMEEIERKADDTPTNDDLNEIEKATTEKKVESRADFLYQDSHINLRSPWYTDGVKDKLNIKVKNITTIQTTASYHIIIGPEYVPSKNTTITKIPDTEVKRDILNITDIGKTNIRDRKNFKVIENSEKEEAPVLTDFDYSEAGIMKKLNISLKFSEEKPKSNDEKKEKPIQRDNDKIKGKDTVLHRIEIAVDNDNEIVQHTNVDERKLNRIDITK